MGRGVRGLFTEKLLPPETKIFYVFLDRFPEIVVPLKTFPYGLDVLRTDFFWFCSEFG
jgi:hypothetical protein